MQRTVGSVVPSGASAPGRIVDVCAYEPSLRHSLGLSQAPAGDPEDEAGFAGLIDGMNRAGVRTVLVALHQKVDEFLRLRREHPGRLCGLAHYDSMHPERGLDAVRALTEGHADAFVGVATSLSCFGQDPRLKVFAPLYEYCVQRGLPVLFRTDGGPRVKTAARPLAFGVLATVYPRLCIVCLHHGAGAAGEMTDLLARFPNLFLATDACPGPEADIRELIRAVGSRKIMFASGGWGGAAADDRGVGAVARLSWRHRANVGWRTAVRAFGPRICKA